MEIYYQGTDITKMVQVNSCIVRDAAFGRCDSLEIEFGNAAGWYSWGPEEDDQIIVAHNGYDSGIMYVNRILPEDGRYRIFAASLPCKARACGNASFVNNTVREIVKSCAMSSGMDFEFYGMDDKTVIPYAERVHEGCAAFLYRLLTLEGATLKCVNGKYAAIDLRYAQARTATQAVKIAANQEGVRYTREGTTLKGLTVKTPYACASAEDTLVSKAHARLTVNDLPAMDNVQAGRWARGKLLSINRQCEKVVMKSTFNSGMTALTRIDIEGDTDATGEWIADEVEHDLKNMDTTAILRRCVWTIQ